jgi:tetratricopeptide (TPR) repeat protein
MAKPQSKGFERNHVRTIAYLRRNGKLCFPLSLALSLVVAGPGLAAETLPPAAAERVAKDRYEHCVGLVQQDPTAAERNGADWVANGGGAAAFHCEALALVALKRYGEAAGKLDLAAAEKSAGIAMRSELLDQAGNAWLLAGQADKAEASLTMALSFAPQNEDVLADRARARGLRKDWKGAEADLTAVLALDPNRADIYVLRASARHAQGRKADASADLAHAFDIYPDYPEALVERGTMKLESGDVAGARADWQLAASAAPDSDAGTTARERLSAIKASAKPPAKH